jgi:dihydrofolate reductase
LEKSVFLKGDVAEEVRKLKQQDDPDIWVYGSGNLIQTLLKHDLIDEFWLKICPITLVQVNACSRKARFRRHSRSLRVRFHQLV